MYRCQICNVTSKPGQAQLKHQIYRKDKSILREFPVCPKCKRTLDGGIPAEELLQRYVKPVPKQPLICPVFLGESSEIFFKGGASHAESEIETQK